MKNDWLWHCCKRCGKKEMLRKHDNGNLITYLKTLFTKGMGRFCKY